MSNPSLSPIPLPFVLPGGLAVDPRRDDVREKTTWLKRSPVDVPCNFDSPARRNRLEKLWVEGPTSSSPWPTEHHSAPLSRTNFHPRFSMLNGARWQQCKPWSMRAVRRTSPLAAARTPMQTWVTSQWRRRPRAEARFEASDTSPTYL
jgi:hypothetical protein